MVAWHEVPGMRRKNAPVPEGRCDYLFALVYKDPVGVCRVP
jgi:hypothetical protein